MLIKVLKMIMQCRNYLMRIKMEDTYIYNYFAYYSYSRACIAITETATRILPKMSR